MDCNLSMQQTSSLGESTAAAPPGLAGFNGEAPMATNQAPQEGGYLENGQMSASDAMFKPVEAELDYRSVPSSFSRISDCELRVAGLGIRSIGS